MKWISKIAVVLWMGVIFWMSAQNGDDSGKLSGGLLQGLLTLIENLSGNLIADSEALHTLIRKLAHLTAYFILALLLDWAMDVEIKRWKRIVIVLAICAAYAVTDEIHQAFVPGRGPSAKDVVIDTFGGFLGLLGKNVASKWHSFRG